MATEAGAEIFYCSTTFTFFYHLAGLIARAADTKKLCQFFFKHSVFSFG